MSIKQNITSLQNLLEQVNALPEEVEPVAPSIAVDSTGLVTATAGALSATKQLSVSDDVDFKAENIKSGVSIFGVNGTYEGGVGDTESTMKFATGTFMPTSSELYSNPVTVSGLNFKPKSLIIAIMGGTDMISLPQSTAAMLLSLATGELFDEYISTYFFYNKPYVAKTADVYVVEFTQDGFILSATMENPQILCCEYAYYAFG